MSATGDGASDAASPRASAGSAYLPISIFECLGTGSMKELTPIKRGADRRYFRHTTVTGYLNRIALGVSVPAGVRRVGEHIEAHPGRFVLVGTSQGAQIMSEVYKLLVSGSINRLHDCVGIYLMGNPEREQGRGIPVPNTATAPGHGIAAAHRRLQGTPDWVWEFARSGDPICDCGDSPTDLAQTWLYELLMGNRPAWVRPGIAVTAITKLVSGMRASHNSYRDWKPDGANTVPQLILEHLNTTVGPAHAFDYCIAVNEQ